MHEMWQPGESAYGSNCTLRPYYDDIEILDLLNDLSNDTDHTNYYMENDPYNITLRNPEREQ